MAHEKVSLNRRQEALWGSEPTCNVLLICCLCVVIAGCQKARSKPPIVLIYRFGEKADVEVRVRDPTTITDQKARTSRTIWPDTWSGVMETIDGEEYNGAQVTGAESEKHKSIKALARYDDTTQEYIVIIETTEPVIVASVQDPEDYQDPIDTKSIGAGSHNLRMRAGESLEQFGE